MDRSNRVDVVYGVYDNAWTAAKEMAKLSVMNFKRTIKKFSLKDTIEFCTQYGYSIQRLGKGQWALYATHDKEVFEWCIRKEAAQE